MKSQINTYSANKQKKQVSVYFLLDLPQQREIRFTPVNDIHGGSTITSTLDNSGICSGTISAIKGGSGTSGSNSNTGKHTGPGSVAKKPTTGRKRAAAATSANTEGSAEDTEFASQGDEHE